MSSISIPKNPKQWRGIYLGKYFGDLWQTFNIDLEREPGRLALSNKMRILASGLGVVWKFMRTDATATDQWFGIVHGTDIIRNGNSSIIGGTWITDDITNTFNDPRDMEIHESANGEQRLVCSRATDIALLNLAASANVWTASWWQTTLSQTALTSSNFHPLAKIQRLLCIGDIVTGTTTKRAALHTIDKSDTVSSSRLLFPSGYTIRLLIASTDTLWIALQGDAGQPAKICEWDGASLSYTERGDLQGSYPLTGWLKNGVPYFITELGYIFKYSGGGFKVVQEFPLREDEQVFSSDITAENTIQPYGSFIDGNLVYINVGAPARTGSSDLTGGSHRMRSGVWIFNTITENLYHCMGLGEHATAGTDIGYGTTPLKTMGAVIRAITGNNPRIVASAEAYIGGTNWNTTSLTAIFQEIYSNVQTSNGGRNRGYFITPYLDANEIEDMWSELWVKFRKFVNSGNQIIVKWRTAEPLRDADAADESPLQAQGTWASTTTFTCVVPTGVAEGHEVEVLTGDNSGCCFKISTLSATPNGSATITVTISEAAPTNSTDKSIFRFDNWTSETAITDTTIEYKRAPFTAVAQGVKLQCKIELRGFSNEIDNLILNSKSKTKVNQA